LALALLAGCRAVPVKPPPAGPAWETGRAQLQARDHFELRGRVAVASGNEGFNAHLRWQQSGPVAQLDLEGPLGAGAVHVTADGPNLSVTTSKGEKLDDAAARSELTARLGFEPPLASLRYWLLGAPDPSQPAAEQVDPRQQRLQSLQQGGWQIDYPAYMMAGSESLPARINLQRAGVRVRLIADSWNP
jgi:outer membrane lipoprotein LolB